jgi:hypothetical protein
MPTAGMETGLIEYLQYILVYRIERILVRKFDLGL